MKHPEPFRREEPPPKKTDLLEVMLAVGGMLFALGLAAFCLRDAGIISSETLLIILIALVTAAGCVFMVLDSERQASPPVRRDEVAPPPDIYLVWPPAKAMREKDDAKASRDRTTSHGRHS